MTYAEKNHTDGPDKFVIGGELNIETGGKLTFGSLQLAPAAAQAANATAAATDLTTTEALANSLQTDFNALLTKLKAAGIMLSA